MGRAKVTLAICGIFLFCHLFKWVLNIYELYFRFRNNHLSEEETESMMNGSDWFIAVVNISNTLVILNSSINFYVYVLKDCWTKLTTQKGSQQNENVNNTNCVSNNLRSIRTTNLSNNQRTTTTTTFSMKPRHNNAYT